MSASKEIMLDIAIPVLNEENRLKSGIEKMITFLKTENLLSQTQLSIADNGSTDRTEEHARELVNIYSNVRYLKVGQKGVGLALKKAWGDSTGTNNLDPNDEYPEIQNIPPIIDDGTSRIIYNWFNNPGDPNSYPLVVFIDDTTRWNPQNHDGSTGLLTTRALADRRWRRNGTAPANQLTPHLSRAQKHRLQLGSERHTDSGVHGAHALRGEHLGNRPVRRLGHADLAHRRAAAPHPGHPDGIGALHRRARGQGRHGRRQPHPLHLHGHHPGNGYRGRFGRGRVVLRPDGLPHQ